MGIPYFENKKVSKFVGFVVSWFLGSLSSWFFGIFVLSFLGFLVSAFLSSFQKTQDSKSIQCFLEDIESILPHFHFTFSGRY